MRVDMHTHSTASDGTERPAEVARRARAAGLDIFALTDHDGFSGHAEASANLPAGLTLVPGVEISCRLDGHSVHMLAYWADPGNRALSHELSRVTTDRLRRAEAMIGKLNELGVPVTWRQVQRLADGGVVGRPHIARAMVEAGAISAPEQAFTKDWLAPGGRAHVSRYALDPVGAVQLVAAAGGVTVLAHPGALKRGWRIPSDFIAALAAAGLSGLEVDHPDHDIPERNRLTDLATSLGLVTTGGSDDHGTLTGHRLGCELTTPDAFESLRARAGHGR